GSADTPPAHRAPSRRGAGRGRAGPRVGEEERAPSRPSARPRCGPAGAERDRLAHAAWNEYDAYAPSGCLRVRGILLGRSPRILRLQTVFRILTSAHSCRIRGERRIHADVNAARIIGRRRSLSIGSGLVTKAGVLQEAVCRFLERYPRPRQGRSGPEGRPADPRWTNPYFKDWCASVTSMLPTNSAPLHGAARQ